jgi:AcrR family transcriptional regulator
MSTRPDAVEPVPPIADRRTTRRQQTKDEIVAAAWGLVREQGLAGLAMRDLGDRVGMKAQSIYSYFGSKHEIYDAMFHEGYVAFAAAMAERNDDSTDADAPGGSPRMAARRAAHRFFEFCTSDPARYQLLFQRTIPDFVPSAESYAVALQTFEATKERLATIGISDPEAVDLWTGLMTRAVIGGSG